MSLRPRHASAPPRFHDTSPPKPADRGFTLLEVLVALAIAAPSLALLYGQGAHTLSTGRTAAAYQEAVSRAQSRLDALSGALLPGERSGEDGGGYRWRTWVAPLATLPPAREPGARTAPGRGTSLYAVRVELAWGEGAAQRVVTLSTRRLGPAADAPP